MNCLECEAIKNKKHVIYEDQHIAAMLSDKPSAAGHILVLPRQHFPIVETIPDETFAHLFLIANKLAIVCFEALGAEGTNILIQNGVPAGQKSSHAQLNVIPRSENDGLNFQWNTIKVSEDELSTIHLKLKDALENPVQEQKKEEVKEVSVEPVEEIPEGENYLLKQLERVP